MSKLTSYQPQSSFITKTTTEEPMSGIPPTNPAKKTSNKKTATIYVTDAANGIETGIDTLPRNTPPQLTHTTSKQLVALTNSNPPTV